jgi:hypothetical protein
VSRLEEIQERAQAWKQDGGDPLFEIWRTSADGGQVFYVLREVAEAIRMEQAQEVQRLRDGLGGLLADVEKTRAYRAATGMRPTHDVSPFSSVVPSGLREIEFVVRALLGPPEEGATP